MNPHRTSTGTSSEPARSDSLCSCSKLTCDSLFCFAKRHDYASCSCNNCGKPKSCPYYGTQITGINEVCDGTASSNPAGQRQRPTVIGFSETCHGPAIAQAYQKECCSVPVKNTPSGKNEGEILNLLKAILGFKSCPTPCCTDNTMSSEKNPVNLEKYIEQISKSHQVGIKPSYKLQRYIDEITQKTNNDICTEMKKQRDVETTKKLEDYIKQITENKKTKPISSGYNICSEMKNSIDKKYVEKLDKYIQDITQPKTAKPKHVNEFGEVCGLIKKFLDQMHTENLSKSQSRKEPIKECQLCKQSTEKKHKDVQKESSQPCCHASKRNNQIEELCDLIKKTVGKKDCNCSKTDTSETCVSDKRKDQKRLENSCKILKKRPTCNIGINTEAECKRMHDDCNDICKLEKKRSCPYNCSSRNLQRSCQYNINCRNLPTNKSDELEVKENQVDYIHHETNDTQRTDISFHASVSRPICNSSISSIKIIKEKSDYGKNLITRLKEAYQACSCRICECVSGKLIKPDPCYCKPCYCVECAKYMKINQSNACSCKPCNCYKCAKIIMCKRQDCLCNTCECIECRRTPNYTHSDRTEKRCLQGTKDCAIYDTVYRCESSQSDVNCSSTGIRRAKRCDSSYKQTTTCSRRQGETPSRSITGLMQELGIDTLLRDLCLLNESGSKSCCSIRVKATDPKQTIICKSKNKRNNYDTLAMFASVSNTFSIFTSKNTIFNKKSCECEECECIASICKEKISSMKESDVVISEHVDETCIYRKHEKLTSNNTNSKLHTSPKFYGSKKKCSLCKRDISSICAIASKGTEYNGFNPGNKTSSKSNTKFITIPVSEYYEICKYMENKQNKSNPIEGLCRCTDCKCERCFGDECFTQSKVNSAIPITKGEMLTPSSHQIKIQSLMLKRQSDGLFRSACQTISKTSQTNIHKHPKDTNIRLTNNRPTSKWLNDLLNIITTTELTVPHGITEVEDTDATTDKKALKNKTYKIVASKDAEKSYFDSKYERHNSNNHNTYYKSSDSSISDYVSLESIPSQYNLSNSRHNYPSYNWNNNSNKGPKSTLEVCLKDVMELNLDRDIKLDDFRIIYKPNNPKNYNNETDLKYMSDNRSSVRNYEPIGRYLTKDLYRQSSKTVNSKWDHSSSKNYNKRRAYYSSKRAYKCYQTKSKNITSTDSTELIRVRQSRKNLKNSSSNSKEKTSKLTQLEQLQRFNLEQEINNDTCLSVKESATGNRIKSTNQVKSAIDDDYYIRVQRTLQEANDYSKKLMSILEKYEKANKEFESVSMKFKHSQELFISDKYTKQQLNSETRNFKNQYVAKQINRVKYKSSAQRINKSTVTCKRNKYAISNNNFNKSEPKGENFLDMNYCFMDGSIENNYILNHDVLNNLCPFEHAEFHLTTKQADSTQDVTETISREVKKKSKRTLKMSKKHEMKLKETIYKKTNKKRGKFMRHAIVGSKRIKAKKGWHKLLVTSRERLHKSISTSILYFKTEDDEAIDYYERPEENGTTEEYKNFVIPNDVSKNVATNTDYAELYFNESIENIDSENTFVLTLKKSCQTKALTENQGVLVSNSVNFGSLQSMPSQTDKQFCTYHYKNEALTRLQSEVHELSKMLLLPTQNCTEHTDENEKKLDDKGSVASVVTIERQTLSRSSTSGDKDWSSDHSYTEKDVHIETRIQALVRMGLLQPILDRIVNNEMIGRSNITSEKNCGGYSDPHKVGSVGARSVSQHTALVEWDLPRVLDDVEGYEILVDGRPVENLVSPDQNMALITCLPEVDQLLLTVRTILRANDARYPSTTFVYRPEIKSH